MTTTRNGGAMNATALRKRVTEGLIREIDEVQFPSVTMLNRVEPELATRDDLATYAETLVKKVEATRYPSISLLNRLDSLFDRLDQLEQLERRQQRESARNDDAGED